MENRWIGAVDIGGTKIQMGIVNAAGEVVTTKRIPTPFGTDAPLAFCHELKIFLENFTNPLSGIGVICTGPIDAKAGVVHNPYTLPGWDHFALRAHLSQMFSIPVAMEHDVCGMLLGNMKLMRLGGKRSLLIAIGTGIGCAYFDGAQLHGKGMRFAPEMGHVLCASDGPDCYCGQHGCFEALCAGPALASFAQENGFASFSSLLANAPKETLSIAQSRMQRGIWNLLVPLKPEVLLIGGGAGTAHFEWIKGLVEQMTKGRDAIFEAFDIIPVSSSSDSALIGAAELLLPQ